MLILREIRRKVSREFNKGQGRVKENLEPCVRKEMRGVETGINKMFVIGRQRLVIIILPFNPNPRYPIKRMIKIKKLWIQS